MKRLGTFVASLSLILGPSAALAAPSASNVAMGRGSCAEAIDVMVNYWGYRRSTLWCNGAVRSQTWRVHQTNGCYTDITFYNSGDIGGGTHC